MTNPPKHYCSKSEVDAERCLEEILRGNDVSHFSRASQEAAHSHLKMTERRLNPMRLVTVDGARIAMASS